MPIEVNTNTHTTQRSSNTCRACGDEVNIHTDEFFRRNGNIYCENCHNENFRECIDCGEELDINNEEYHTYVEGGVLCQNCYENDYGYCSGCDNVFHNDNIIHCNGDDNYYCSDCHSDCESCSREQEQERRRINVGNFYKNSKKSQLNKNDLKEKDNLNAFGIEVESIINDTDFSKRDKRLDYFQITHDGSLSSNGVEFISSILKNYRPIKAFCNLAKEHLDIDRSCGFHIHLYLDKKFQTLIYIKKILLSYYLSQEFWFKMVSSSRQNSSYCHKLKLGELNSYLMCGDMKQFDSRFYSHIRDNIPSYKRDKYFGKRYSWVNVHSIFHRNTIEIRNHNGTINYKKIVNWLSLHRRFLKFVLKNSQKKIYDKLQTFEGFKSIFNKKLRDYVDERVVEFQNEKVDDIKDVLGLPLPTRTRITRGGGRL